ncbi:hypothetical protein KM043_015357 [Ampulex compressa]|nr:hypothetical protein KM043_015357 [Ampulex compressa]
MSDLAKPTACENKLNDLNKKIAEIKKKIQLSEGQRKANFEEYDAKKQENAEKIASLKQKIKELYVEYAKTKTHNDKESKSQKRGTPSVHGKKRSLKEAIVKIDEENLRLRQKLDLFRYQKGKQQRRLNTTLDNYDELVVGKTQKIFKRKVENPVKSKIVRLEVRLEHIRMMQIKANIARMKYRSVHADLKGKSILYASSLKELEDEIKEQENEIKRLQGVKEEAIELRDNTQETLTKEEIEVTNSGKERDLVIQNYRQRVLERKTELERLERMIFQSRPRDDFDTRGKSRAQATEDITKDEVSRLEDAFAKLRSATGVSRTEDVLNRFLGQRATKDNLQKMRTTTEEEKMLLEKKRQELANEIETRKFSETKNAEQNAEAAEQFNKQIKEQQDRQENAEEENRRLQSLVEEITVMLCALCEKLRDVTDTLPENLSEVGDPLELIRLLNDKVNSTFETLNETENYLDVLDEVLIDKLETMSLATTSMEGKATRTNGGPLFPRFPSTATPAAVPSEDEEEVPTRTVLKKQAQQLVDAKSRRKGFNFRR